jgi:hypothetical protein
MARKIRNPARVKGVMLLYRRIKARFHLTAGLRLARIMAIKPHTPFIRVINEGRTAIYIRRLFLRGAAAFSGKEPETDWFLLLFGFFNVFIFTEDT